MERVLITIDDVQVGVAHDSRPDICKLKVGGAAKDRLVIERIANEYFGVDVHGQRGEKVEPTFTQANKLMFVCRKPRLDFVKGIERLREHEITVTEGVTSFGRLMR